MIPFIDYIKHVNYVIHVIIHQWMITRVIHVIHWMNVYIMYNMIYIMYTSSIHRIYWCMVIMRSTHHWFKVLIRKPWKSGFLRVYTYKTRKIRVLGVKTLQNPEKPWFSWKNHEKVLKTMKNHEKVLKTVQIHWNHAKSMEILWNPPWKPKKNRFSVAT